MTDATPTPDQRLHLPSLVIKNFRGIDELTIPRLGRVTLLAGKNGVGKTTVLDAVRIYANGGQGHAIDEVLRARGDAFFEVNESTRTRPDWNALFTNRYTRQSATIATDSGDEANVLYIRALPEYEDSPDCPDEAYFPDPSRDDLIARFGDAEKWSWVDQKSPDLESRTVLCDTLGPDAPTDDTVERYWSELALTSHEDRALEALNLITDTHVERVAALGPPISGGIIQPRRMMAKVTGRDYQVPLRTLGDGAMRTYAVALALAKSGGGFLLIDEVENGIHHSVQPKFWKMVLQTAQRNNVQVLATTHSWDCVRGFARAANELEDVEGILYRIQRNLHRLRAVPYPEDQLAIAAESGIEVR